MENKIYHFFATTPKGLELLLVDELKSLGALNAAEKLAGVSFSGDLALAYRVCLWSRLANRVLLPLAKFPAPDEQALYNGIQSIDWDKQVDVDGTIAVHFVTSNSAITHTLYGAQKIKDAVVDQFKEKTGSRPSVDRAQPDIQIYAYLHHDVAEISLDLSGESLHRRGYRAAGGVAPLKENLAAAILIRAGWPLVAKEKGSLLDPMCGSGTLLIEAALMAGNIAPGIFRHYFGFLGWKQHQAACWEEMVIDAEQKKAEGLDLIPEIIGYDQDSGAIKNAFRNIECAGLQGRIHVEKRELDNFELNKKFVTGLVVTNPPYGERLGEESELQPLYTLLGDRLKKTFSGWSAAVFTGNPELGKVMGIRSIKQYALFNGAIPCKLLLFKIQQEYFIDRTPEADNHRRIRAAKRAVGDVRSEGLEMFINRFLKNNKHRSKQAAKKDLNAYRVYDADLPEYAFAIDIEGNQVTVAEYQAPKTVDPVKVTRRRNEVLSVIAELLEVEAGQVFYQMIRK